MEALFIQLSRNVTTDCHGFPHFEIIEELTSRSQKKITCIFLGQYRQKKHLAALEWHIKLCTISSHCAIFKNFVQL